MIIDLSSLLRAIVRRWYATIPVFCVVAMLAGIVLRESAAPEYSASGSLAVLQTGVEVVEVPIEPDPDAVVPTPEDPGPGDDTSIDGDVADLPAEVDEAQIELEERQLNPYEQFTASVGATASVLEEYGASGEFRRSIGRQGLSSDFTVVIGEGAPLLRIEAVSDDPDIATATVVGVAEALTAELERRQDQFGAPEQARIVLDEVVIPTRATRDDSARNRAMVLFAILAVVAVALTAMLVDAIDRAWPAESRRRFRRRLRRWARSPLPETWRSSDRRHGATQASQAARAGTEDEDEDEAGDDDRGDIGDSDDFDDDADDWIDDDTESLTDTDADSDPRSGDETRGAAEEPAEPDAAVEAVRQLLSKIRSSTPESGRESRREARP